MIVKVVIVTALLAALWWIFLAKKRPPLRDAEAREVLGVRADADADTIRAAHRRLVSAVHPDKGGSAELTRRINAARDVLLKRVS